MFKKNRKTYKTTERKGNPRTGLQRRLIHTSRQLRHGGVEENREQVGVFYGPYIKK